MKTIETQIEINASPQKVWNVLMDFDAHEDWNPFIQSIEGDVTEGDVIKVTIKPPSGKPMQFEPVVLRFNEPKEFRWKGKLFFIGVFDGEHYFKIDSLGGKSVFTHGEQFSGVLVPFLRGVIADAEKGFNLMNKALKEQCEK